MIGKPEAAGRIEHEIIGRNKPLALAFRIERLRFSSRNVDALDASARVRRRRMPGNEQASPLVEFETSAIVANEKRAAGTDRESIWPSSRRRNPLMPPIRPDPCDAARSDLDHEHRAILHGDGPFGKPQTRCDLPICHGAPLLRLAAR